MIRYHRMLGEPDALGARLGPRRHRHAERGGARSGQGRARPATTWAARSSWSASGSGRPSTAASSPASTGGSASRATGIASASRWTRGCRAPCATAFVRLYDKGLIYRGTYLVNWCPRCGTAISDLEVDHEEEAGKLWYVRYPLLPEGAPQAENLGGPWGSGRWAGWAPSIIEVATTRPETILGDTAVAVNPNDERYTAGWSGARRSCRPSGASSRSSPTRRWTRRSAPARSR